MNILVTATHVPFIQGGAEQHMQGLVRALRQHGHRVELLRIPFQFNPASAIENAMTFTQNLDMTRPNGIEIDQVISLQFPSYGLSHPNHRIWLMHQHRAVYDLYDPKNAPEDLKQLKSHIQAFDQRSFANAKKRFANSKNVAQRLYTHNQTQAEPLYHPPPMADHFFCEQDQGYIYCPSRLETLKRQSLLIQAVARSKSSRLKVLISGTGGQQAQLEQLIEQHQLGDQIRLLGHVSDAQKLTLYANATAVFFAPFDEDYGYVTLEAMLSAKPIITCNDAGGVLEFVQHGINGWVTDPTPEAIAEVLTTITPGSDSVRQLGRNALQAYSAKNITWTNVVKKLTEER
ncbi:MAG: glycosyltransferase family 4 protein [Hydrogenovibrio sp.]|uniref:glycosyltransferase family 4 protein n=1 Tax=Hydrogenovibrio sp. TaxID=2065821 RepID=UPI00286FFFC4|nr:glycosyltransferase family 4 protein [Hydrogenovibrio sp.]MDR9499706.1 glycosyltransferase family 4 protein [Hydrogenovibrio sp.]